MRHALLYLFACALVVAPLWCVPPAMAVILEWEWIDPLQPELGKRESQTLVPDGAGVNVVPGVDLRHRDLTKAYFIGEDLTDVGFYDATLTWADFTGSNLTHANFYRANLTEANFTDANLTNANLFYPDSLTDADFTGAIIRGADFEYTTPRGFTAEQLYSTASYQAGDLTGIVLGGNNLHGWNFAGQDLTDSDFSSTRGQNRPLTDADFSGAVVRGANFSSTVSRGFTASQLYSTASYQSGDLVGISLSSNALTGWNFAGKNLTAAVFGNARLTGADFTGANLNGVTFSTPTLSEAKFTDAIVHDSSFRDSTSSGFTAAQFYSTASFQTGNLTGIGLRSNDLRGWNFSGKNLTDADFRDSLLDAADLTNANLRNVKFHGASLTDADFASADLSNASFFSASLVETNLTDSDLTNSNFTDATLNSADFTRANLTDANFATSLLTSANFTNAVVMRASFRATIDFTAEQLYSTDSYQHGDLSGINFSSNDLTGWNFAGKNLTDANFVNTTLTAVDFSGANLTNGSLNNATMNDANFSGAVLRGADLGGATSRGFTAAQLYSTASYQTGDLVGISFSQDDLTGWNFAGKNLTNSSFYGGHGQGPLLTDTDFLNAVIRGAHFAYATTRGFTKLQLYSTTSYQSGDLAGIILFGNNLTDWNFAGKNLSAAFFGNATLTDADFTSADTRDASLNLHHTTITRNMIGPNGHIEGGLNIGTAENIRLWDYDGETPLPIVVEDGMSMDPSATLRAVFEADEWGSTISFEAGIQVQLGGTLLLEFEDEVNLAAQLGRTIDLFDWDGVSPNGVFTVSSPYDWDLSGLYTTGEVTLIDIQQLPGDFDGDRDVDGDDFFAWQRDPGVGSLVHWQANFGTDLSGNAGIAAVPEPSSLVLLLMAVFLGGPRALSARALEE